MELRKLSSALWDEDTYTIRLDHIHYAEHIKDLKADVEYLNKPIPHYGKMLIIFGNSLATGNYAKGSSEPLVTETIPIDDEEDYNSFENVAVTNPRSGVAAPNEENGASSSAPKPKKARTTHATEEDGLVGTFHCASERLAAVIEKAGKSNNELPKDLFDSVHSISGFEEVHLAHYHAHLVDHPSTARVFITLPLTHKITWVARYVATIFRE